MLYIELLATEHLRRNVWRILKDSFTRPESEVVVEQCDMQPIAARIANFARKHNFGCCAPADPIIRARCDALSEKIQSSLRELRTEIDSTQKNGDTRELIILIKLMDLKSLGFSGGRVKNAHGMWCLAHTTMHLKRLGCHNKRQFNNILRH